MTSVRHGFIDLSLNAFNSKKNRKQMFFRTVKYSSRLCMYAYHTGFIFSRLSIFPWLLHFTILFIMLKF